MENMSDSGKIHLGSTLEDAFTLREMNLIRNRDLALAMLSAVDWTCHPALMPNVTCFSPKMANSTVNFFTSINLLNLSNFLGEPIPLPDSVHGIALFPAVTVFSPIDKIEGIFDQNAFKYDLHKHFSWIESRPVRV